MSRGKVWLVGAGPSDPGLFTLKGKAVLERADAVVYDRLVGVGILAMAPAGSEMIDVGKNAGNHSMSQDEINSLLVRLAQNGKKVVRLKGGDPFLFGRGGEEAEALAIAGISYEVVSGVTAATAVPAYFGIPVTHREAASSLHLITAHRKAGMEQPLNYEALAALGPGATLIFFMGVAALEEICAGLIGAGMPPETPAAVLEKGTSAGQRKTVATLADLAQTANEQGIETPGLIVVGGVCRLADKLAWAEERSLHGVRVFVTRPRGKNSVLSKTLSELGAEVVELPSVRTEFLEPAGELLERKSALSSYNWLICSSPVGAEAFFRFLRRERLDLRSLPNLRFAAVGEKTRAALEERGVVVDCCPEEYNGRALARALLSRLRPEDKVLALVPQNRESAVVAALREKAVCCDTAAVYRTVAEAGFVPQLRPGDCAVFASASAVEGFGSMAGGRNLEPLRAFCIGKQTARAAKQLGMNPIVAEQASIKCMVEKLLEYHLQERSGQL